MTDSNEIKKIAKLAKISIDANDMEKLQNDFNQIKQFIDQIKLFDTTQAIHLNVKNEPNAYRNDQLTENHNANEMLANAPHAEGQLFLVPKVLS